MATTSAAAAAMATATLAANVTTPNASEGTQLAQSTPQLDVPQRIEAPESIKTPSRSALRTRDDRIRSAVFAPRATALWRLQRNLCKDFDNGDQLARSLPCCVAQELQVGGPAVSAKLLKDYAMLAEASKRAGRHDAECAAHLCLGIIYDNGQDYSKAIDCYLLVLSIGESSQQTMFAALACNCIGVDYQLLSCVGKAFAYTGEYVDAASPLLQRALTFHQKHAEIADDAGKFVAHLNMGLTYGSLGQANEAALHHQEALRLAIRLNSTYGQSLAVGNLGLLASRQDDVETAVACMEQHLQLIQGVNDRSGEAFAWIQLGNLAARAGDNEKAVRALDQAYRIAQDLGEPGVVKQCACYLGVVRARLHMEAFARDLLARAESATHAPVSTAL